MTDNRIRCDGCGEHVTKCLIDRGKGPGVKLACGCFVFDRTQGIYRPFKSDLPDRWYDEQEDVNTLD